MKKDIKLAISKELEFVRAKIYKREEDIGTILDYVGEAGYNNLEDFYKDKLQYIMKSIHLEIVKAPKIDKKFKEYYIKESIPALLYAIHTGEDYLFVTDETEDIEAPAGLVKVNLEYKSQYNLIVSPDGDLRIYVIVPMFTGIDCQWFLEKMRNYLSKFFDNVDILDDRFITIDGKIVIRSISQVMNKMLSIMFNISFVDSSEIVKMESNEDREKNGVIDSRVLTAEEFKDEIVSWVN